MWAWAQPPAAPVLRFGGLQLRGLPCAPEMGAALGRAVASPRCWAAGDPVADTPPQGRVSRAKQEKQTAGCLPIKFFSALITENIAY